MYTPLFIAKRYFATRPQQSLIYRMGLIACISVAISTIALLLVMSVFNGLEDVIKKLFYAFDPDFKVELKQGKYFTMAPELIQKIEHIDGVAKVVEVIEEHVLLSCGGKQVVAKVKGVSDNFIQDNPLANHILDGKLRLQEGNTNFALVGAGIQYALSIRLNNIFENLQVFFPRQSKLGSMPSQQLYRSLWIIPGAIFAIEKHFDDNYVIVPLRFATQLLGNTHQRTALEIQIVPGTSTSKLQKALQTCLPASFRVLNRDEQQVTLLRTIRIERLLAFTTFSIIVIAASLNIFFILSMLVLAKRRDVAILYTLGATPRLIKHIFLLEGLLIGVSGAIAGMTIAWVLAELQQRFGFISIGMQASLLEAYPVKKQLSDFIYVGVGVFLITLLASYRPAILATQVHIRNHLAN